MDLFLNIFFILNDSEEILLNTRNYLLELIYL